MARNPTRAEVYDVVIIGGGAAGLFCASTAGKRGRRVLVLEHCPKIGKKILISGGGRCNFTNLYAEPNSYQSENPHFPKSALARFTQHDFISLVEKHNIPYHEKTLGQLFCSDSSRRIVAMLLDECSRAKVEIACNATINAIESTNGFLLSVNKSDIRTSSLVIATGGISIPKMGASPFGYRIAEQFGLELVSPRPGLVPFVFDPETLRAFDGLSGISVPAVVSCGETSFAENILITHRGISGPAILQISSFWRDGESIEINLLPEHSFSTLVAERLESNREIEVRTLLAEYLPKRLVQRLFEVWLESKPLKQLSNSEIDTIDTFLRSWKVVPAGTEGYRTAEVTIGGVATNELSSKTFESQKIPGLYFIGEVVDVTGWLGGYNFQWAWSSGYCAGLFV